MSLTEYEVDMIKKAFKETFGDGSIYLFGSRVDDSKRGGDIDLYLVPDKKYEDERDKKIKFFRKYWSLVVKKLKRWRKKS